jgi:hypothetical protein
MKNQTNVNLLRGVKLLSLLTILASNPLFAQEEETGADKRPVRSTFESALLMDLQSVMVPNHKTLEFDIQHRFGTVGEGITDLFGIYAPANIRMGFSYTPVNNLAVGFGFGKFKKYLDFSLKYAILKQRRDWSVPLSLTYYANIARDSRDKSIFNKPVHRFSYHHELIIASRLSSKFSLQVAPSFSHYNAMDSLYSNDIIAISAGGRFRFSSQGAFLINYVQQVTNHDDPNFDLKPDLTFGLEFSTGSHAFQLFVSNYQGILPQENNTFNEYDFTKGEFLIGFNITRLWNF